MAEHPERGRKTEREAGSMEGESPRKKEGRIKLKITRASRMREVEESRERETKNSTQ